MTTQLAETIRLKVRPARIAKGLVIEWHCSKRNEWIECSYATEQERDAMISHCDRKGYQTRQVTEGN
jgi:hypothetical protein